MQMNLLHLTKPLFKSSLQLKRESKDVLQGKSLYTGNAFLLGGLWHFENITHAYIWHAAHSTKFISEKVFL